MNTENEAFHELRQAFYGADSWASYRRTLANIANPDKGYEDRGAYLPNPRVLRERVAQLNWLKAMGFEPNFIHSIMRHDCPSFQLVKRLVKRYGVAETKDKLRPMLDDYDLEACE